MKRALVALTLALSLLLGSAASATEILDTDAGYGRVTVNAWSRGYHNIGILGFHTGSFVRVRLRAECANGWSKTGSWTDGGQRFRLTFKVPVNTRCTYYAVMTNTNGRFMRLGIAAW